MATGAPHPEPSGKPEQKDNENSMQKTLAQNSNYDKINVGRLTQKIIPLEEKMNLHRTVIALETGGQLEYQITKSIVEKILCDYGIKYKVDPQPDINYLVIQIPIKYPYKKVSRKVIEHLREAIAPKRLTTAYAYPCFNMQKQSRKEELSEWDEIARKQKQEQSPEGIQLIMDISELDDLALIPHESDNL